MTTRRIRGFGNEIMASATLGQGVANLGGDIVVFFVGKRLKVICFDDDPSVEAMVYLVKQCNFSKQPEVARGRLKFFLYIIGVYDEYSIFCV